MLRLEAKDRLTYIVENIDKNKRVVKCTDGKTRKFSEIKCFIVESKDFEELVCPKRETKKEIKETVETEKEDK